MNQQLIQALAAEILRNPAPPAGVPIGVAPLARQFGVVTDVAAGPPLTVTLTLGGSAVPIAGVACLNNFTPTVGQMVAIDKSGEMLMVVGSHQGAGGSGSGGGVWPIGLIGSASRTSTQGSITAVTDLTGLSVTVTVGAGRQLKLTGFCGFSTANGSIGADLYIREGATTLAYDESSMSNSVQATCAPIALIQPTAGSHTYKLSAGPVAGNTIATMSSAVIPALLLVEDVGSV